MKKIILFIFTLLLVINLSAQSDSIMKNKNGYPILPEQGDFAVGISMTPILGYLGNFFHGTGITPAPMATFRTNTFQNNAVFFKYFNSNNSAFRVNFEFTSNHVSNSYYVQDDAAVAIDPLSNKQVTDIQLTDFQNYVLGFGYEKRRGKTRLQGIYGVDLLFSYQNLTNSYKYGNPMSPDNQMPTTHNFGTNLYNGGRVLKTYNGEVIGVGLNAFLGFEYFVLPKISLGAEFAYGLWLTKTRQAKFKYEVWNVDHVENIEATDPGDVGRFLGSANPYANFFLMLHF